MGREFSVSQADFGWQLNVVNWPLVFLSGLFLFTRIFLKIHQRRGLWWDDYFLVLSWVTLGVQSALWAVMIDLGYGKDFRLIPVENLVEMALLLEVASMLLILAILWSKTSFAITLLRLPLRWAKSVVWFIIIAMTVIIGTSAIFVWAQCVFPGPGMEDPFSGFRCLPPKVGTGYSIFAGAYSAAMDFTLAVLPWRYLWTLPMKTSERIGVTVAMSMGVFAGIAAIIKTTLFPRLTSDIMAGLQVIAWGAVEAAVSIIAASIPILRALVRQSNSGPRGGYDFSGETYLGASTTRTTTTTATRVGRGPRDTTTAPAAVGVERTSGKEREGGRGGRGKRNGDGWDEMGRMEYGVEMTSYGVEVRPRDFTA